MVSPHINLRCDATPSQVRQLIVALRKILDDHPLVEVGKIPIRFTGIASYSYDWRIFAYVLTSQFDDYLKVQTDLLLQILDAVEAAGTGTLWQSLYRNSPERRLSRTDKKPT